MNELQETGETAIDWGAIVAPQQHDEALGDAIVRSSAVPEQPYEVAEHPLIVAREGRGASGEREVALPAEAGSAQNVPVEDSPQPEAGASGTGIVPPDIPPAAPVPSPDKEPPVRVELAQTEEGSAVPARVTLTRSEDDEGWRQTKIADTLAATFDEARAALASVRRGIKPPQERAGEVSAMGNQLTPDEQAEAVEYWTRRVDTYARIGDTLVRSGPTAVFEGDDAPVLYEAIMRGIGIRSESEGGITEAARKTFIDKALGSISIGPLREHSAEAAESSGATPAPARAEEQPQQPTELDERYAALPEILRDRVEVHRARYERFSDLYEESIIEDFEHVVDLAGRFPSAAEIMRFRELPFEEQVAALPAMRDTPPTAVRSICNIALWYLDPDADEFKQYRP